MNTKNLNKKYRKIKSNLSSTSETFREELRENTTKTQGTGFDLAIHEQIIKGSIIRSVKSQGTIFKITIPLHLKIGVGGEPHGQTT